MPALQPRQRHFTAKTGSWRDDRKAAAHLGDAAHPGGT